MVTFSRRGLHGQVVDALGRRIISGDLPPGTIVDLDMIEHEMSVSRTVMREAVKVLTTKGLLDARPRLGTFVRERSDWQLLDADVMVWRGAGEPDERLLSDLEEVRRIVEPWGARLAAERRTPTDVLNLRAALERMERSEAGADVEEHIASDVAFHRAVLAASQNELLERLEVVLEPALRARDALVHAHAPSDAFLHAHSAVADAIADADADRAQTAMAALLETASADTADVLRRRSRAGRSG
ncbi:MAG: FadR family transcriptional regulator [Blastococcus sp.]|nr:FadR family transcriptional regulator [Blastococcus sp.]